MRNSRAAGNSPSSLGAAILNPVVELDQGESPASALRLVGKNFLNSAWRNVRRTRYHSMPHVLLDQMARWG